MSFLAAVSLQVADGMSESPLCPSDSESPAVHPNCRRVRRSYWRSIRVASMSVRVVDVTLSFNYFYEILIMKLF